MKLLTCLALLWQCTPNALTLNAAETPRVLEKAEEVFVQGKTELHHSVQDGRIAGGAYLVVRKGKTVYSEAAGFMDIEEKTPFYEREGLRYRGPHELFPPRMTIAQTADALARVPALHHPGERFTYGFSTDLLGRLIEIWSGEPLDRHLHRTVFKPLEMMDTGFSVPPEKRARFTSCYALSDGKLVVVDPAASSPFNEGFAFLSGGGGLVSTVRDYAKFCQLLVDGGEFKGRRLLKPATLRLMYSDQLHGVDGANRFGLGFAIEDVTLGSGASERKAVCYRWGGYASTQFSIVPDEQLFQIFALQQLPYTEELAKHHFKIMYTGMPPLRSTQ